MCDYCAYCLCGHLFCSVGVALAVGSGSTVYTSDSTSSFSTWTAASTPPVSAVLYDCKTIDGNVFYIVGEGGVMLTWSSGSWSQLSVGTTFDLHTISLISNAELMVQGSNSSMYYFARSADGGASWTSFSLFSNPTTLSYPQHALFMLTSKIAFAGSTNGKIMQTANGGRSWSTAFSATTDKIIFTLSMYSSDVGIAGMKTFA